MPYGYEPGKYIPNFRWVASAGQALGSTIAKLPEAIELDRAFKERKVAKADVHKAMQSHVGEMPDDVLSGLGTNRQELLKTMPSPQRAKTESPEMYTRRLTSWYTRLAEKMLANGVPVDEMKKWGSTVPAQVDVIGQPTVKAGLAEAKKEERGEFVGGKVAERIGVPTAPEAAAQRELEARGVKPEEAKVQPLTVGGQPVTGAAAEERPLVRPQPGTQEAALRGIGAAPPTPGQPPVTTQEALAQPSVAGLPKELTEYQKLMAARGWRASQGQDEQKFFRESQGLWTDAKDYETGIARTEGDLSDANNELREAKAKSADAAAKSRDPSYTDVEIEGLRKQQSEALKAEKAAKKEIERLTEKRIDQRHKRQIAWDAWETYSKSGGRVSYQEALQRAQKGVPTRIGAPAAGAGAGAGGPTVGAGAGAGAGATRQPTGDVSSFWKR